MDMTKDFLNRILELDEPHQVKYNGRLFVDKDMNPIPGDPVVKDPLYAGKRGGFAYRPAAGKDPRQGPV